MKKKVRPPEDTGTWMNTYSDLVTLLLTFFVLLYSMSSVDAEKWEMIVKAFAHPGEDTQQVVIGDIEDRGEELLSATGDTPPPGDKESLEQIDQQMPADFNELYEYLKSYVSTQGLEDSVQIAKENGRVYIRFRNNLFFAPDSSAILADAYPLLDFLGDCLKAVDDEILLINIGGHTAAVLYDETYQVSDWMLSSERASNIAIYLDDKKDLDPKKLRPMGYGKNFPVGDNNTAEGREQNRRVDIMIISNQASLTQDDAMYKAFEGLFDPTKFPESGGVDDLLIPEESFLDGEAGEAASGAESDNQTAAAVPTPPVESGTDTNVSTTNS
ncbi:flagellar motor protein MotB [Anaerotruncus colihominis]|uniref:flagellar motor protein MotB n=1 Tax=Anaerotruncus colihominis TaxID=169435 RepID=UPI0026F1397A|nr:flagellar motor protein MotB [Anaerotruncus colihominis]